MRICQRHWDLLRDAIRERGLYDLVASDGHQAVRNLTDDRSRGSRIQNFDPLMAAHNDLLGHALDRAGPAVMMPDENGAERCPVCFCADLHAATCSDDPCPDPRLDDWARIAADHSKATYDQLLLTATPDDAALRSEHEG